MNGWWIRRGVWPLMELKGNRIRACMRDMERIERMEPEEIRALQKDKLRRLIDHAVRHVPAYRHLREEWERSSAQPGLDPAMFLRERVPVLTKHRFNGDREQYVADNAPRESLIVNRTGGSTGEPTRFYMDRPTVEHYEAARWRGLGWHGIRIGDPSVMVWGSPFELSQAQSRLYTLKERWLKNRILFSAYDLKPERIEEYVRRIRSFRPHYFYGYVSALAMLAQLLLDRGIRLGVPLKAVITTAETLHPHQREAIEKAFGCRAVNEYGARDAGILAYECPHGGMHISAANAWLEVVDVKTHEPLGPGEKGALVVTDLNNYSQPRLRYLLNDVVSLGADRCPCGRGLPLLASIEGREDEIFQTADGTLVHSFYLNQLARGLASFRRFQLIQHSPLELTVKLVRDERFYKPEEEEAFLRGIREMFGESAQLKVEHVEDIPPSPSGKFRYAIREFPLRGKE